jgi:protease I
MALIGVLIDEYFDEEEYTVVTEALREARHQLLILGLGPDVGKTVKGLSGKLKVKIESAVSMLKETDALFIPGGYSPDRLRANDEAVKLIWDYVEAGKSVFACSHGPQLLISAGVLNSRRFTGARSIKQDIRNAGARYLDEPVIEDHNFVSCRGAKDLPLFAHTVISHLSRIRDFKFLQIRDLMVRHIHIIEARATVREAAEIMKEMKVGIMPVREGNRIVGLLFDRDIAVKAVAEKKELDKTMVREIMTRELVYLYEDENALLAAKFMKDMQLRRILVLNHDKEPVGIFRLETWQGLAGKDHKN